MKQFFRYLTVGVFNTMLGYCVIFACMYLAKMSPEISNVAGYAVGLVASYVLNRKFTFNSRQNRYSEIVRFLAVFVVAYALNFMVLIILIHWISLHEGASQLLAGLGYVIASFIMNKFYVFRTSHGSEIRPL
jgi:putative flippase GtrA